VDNSILLDPDSASDMHFMMQHSPDVCVQYPADQCRTTYFKELSQLMTAEGTESLNKSLSEFNGVLPNAS
jgi:hypothetical protein